MSNRLDQSFLDDALSFASTQTRHWAADALACHLHNDGYALEGNTEANDVDWFAWKLWAHDTGDVPGRWDSSSDETKEKWRKVARVVIAALPDYQLRIAHRLITMSKVVRDIERAARTTRSGRRTPSGGTTE